MADIQKNRKQGKNWEAVVRANAPFGTSRIPDTDKKRGADFQTFDGQFVEAKTGKSPLRPKQIATRDQAPDKYQVVRGPTEIPDVPKISEKNLLPPGFKKKKRIKELDDTDLFDY